MTASARITVSPDVEERVRGLHLGFDVYVTDEETGLPRLESCAEWSLCGLLDALCGPRVHTTEDPTEATCEECLEVWRMIHTEQRQLRLPGV